MKETGTKSYDWITACVMMREGKFMAHSSLHRPYRIGKGNIVERWSPADKCWHESYISNAEFDKEYFVVDDPSAPKWIQCEDKVAFWAWILHNYASGNKKLKFRLTHVDNTPCSSTWAVFELNSLSAIEHFMSWKGGFQYLAE